MGKKSANAFGLHDTHGNVREWCEDIFNAEFYKKTVAGGPNPVSKTGSGDRVIQGGCWRYLAWSCRSACRAGDVPAYRDFYLGFRAADRLP